MDQSPGFLCSSATIANPEELAEKICGEKFVLVDQDGSGAPQKEYRLLLPPEIKGKMIRFMAEGRLLIWQQS